MATLKQKGVFNKMVENGGNMGKAMREVGYSEAMAKNPHKVTQSKGFQEIMEKYGLDDATLAKKHKELLESKKVTRTFKKDGLKTEIEELNPLSARALNMAYKVKGHYAPEKSETKIGFSNIGELLLMLDEKAKKARRAK